MELSRFEFMTLLEVFEAQVRADRIGYEATGSLDAAAGLKVASNDVTTLQIAEQLQEKLLAGLVTNEESDEGTYPKKLVLSVAGFLAVLSLISGKYVKRMVIDVQSEDGKQFWQNFLDSGGISVDEGVSLPQVFKLFGEATAANRLVRTGQ